MKLALFDLDHTLLNTDSDHSWGEFLVNEGLVDAVHHRQPVPCAGGYRQRHSAFAQICDFGGYWSVPGDYRAA